MINVMQAILDRHQSFSAEVAKVMSFMHFFPA